MTPSFEFDRNKDIANTRKHGISLRIGIKVLLGDRQYHLTEVYDEQGEERFSTMGPHPDIPGLIMVVYHYRFEDLIRLISVRKANKQEREHYAKEI